MKSILVILLVGSTAALVAAKCKPGGYCEVAIYELSQVQGLLDKVHPQGPFPKIYVVIDAYRQVVKGTNFAILYLEKEYVGLRFPPPTLGFCVVQIFKDLPAGDGGTGKATAIGRPSCSRDLEVSQKYLAKVVGVKEAA